ncbi:MAG: M12 family metallopeptidase, partial [Phycisphaerales bacterium JB043]
MRFVIPRIVLPAVALGFSSHAMAQRADASALHEERADNAQPHDDHASIDCEILVPPGGYRGLSNDYFWPNGIVPYVLDVSSTRAKLARAAMDEIEWVSNVRFVERTTEPNYIRVRNSTGNSAHVGMIGGEQFVNIRSWNTHGTIIHELLHSLSFWHEHQRPDRDTFVEVLWGNIQAGRENNFVTHSFASTFGDYDFQSLMHYGSYAFASCDCFTIRMRPGFESFQGTIGQRAGVSQGDIEMLMHFYGGGPVHIPRTNTSFLTLQGALAQSIPQDRIEASPIGIQAAGSFTIPSQQTLLATASIEQLAALTWTLEQASTLQTRGADISLGGVLEVATGAWGTIRSDYLTADFQSTLKVNPSSTLSIVGREAAIQGEIQLLDDSALLLLSESATLGNNSRVTAGRDSTLIAYGANGLDIASETEMLHGSHLASVNSLSLSQEAHLRINADSSASISSDDMELSGPMRLHARSTLVLDANHLEFQPLSITLEPDASLVLATPTLNAPDSVSIPHKERLLHSAQPGSRVVTAHDMNADGLDDTIINSFTSQGVEIYLNQGEPFYQYQLSQTVDGTMRLATGIDVADI